MATVTIRDLRNHGGEVVDRAAAGERLTITRAGRPVAELRPVSSAALTATVILERWRRLPALELATLRRDLDSVVDPHL